MKMGVPKSRAPFLVILMQGLGPHEPSFGSLLYPLITPIIPLLRFIYTYISTFNPKGPLNPKPVNLGPVIPEHKTLDSEIVRQSFSELPSSGPGSGGDPKKSWTLH